MGQSTLSGPIRSGTVRQGTIATGLNVGRPVLAQQFTVPFASMLAAGSATVMFNLPAGSKITKVLSEVTVALVTATNLGIQIGIAGTVAKFFASFNTGATAGRTAQATVDAGQVTLQTDNIGTADVPVLVTVTAATGDATAGSLVLSIEYIQRNADGS